MMLSWIRSAFLDNLGFKLFALLLAIFLFQKVNQEDPNRVATVDVKLLYAFPTKKLLMTSEPITSIKVTLQGPESKLSNVTSRVWQFTVKLSDAESGPMQTELYTQEIRSIFPGEIQVTRIKPSILNVRFAKRSQRTLPIQIVLKGKPPFGYRLLRPITSFPRKITLEGPQPILAKMDKVTTQAIDLTGKRTDGPVRVSLNHPGKYIRFLGSNTVRATLQFHILKGNKSFEDLPIKVLNFSNTKLDYELKPESIQVQLFGPLAQLQPMKRRELVLEADSSKVASKPPGEHLVPLRIRIPAPELKLAKPLPSHITLVTRWKAGYAPKKKSSLKGSSVRPQPRKVKKRKTHAGKRKKKRRWKRKRRRKKNARKKKHLRKSSKRKGFSKRAARHHKKRNIRKHRSPRKRRYIKSKALARHIRSKRTKRRGRRVAKRIQRVLPSAQLKKTHKHTKAVKALFKKNKTKSTKRIRASKKRIPHVRTTQKLSKKKHSPAKRLKPSR